MITFGNKQICEYCLTEGSGKTCRVCGFDKKNYKKEWGVLSPGSILSGKYIVGKIMGQGGFGITYLAYDTKHEKKVALKEYFPVTYSNRAEDGVTVTASRSEDAELYKSGMEKFYEEASLVSKFNGNPNIVSVYEFFYENDTAYFVMELLRGISLKAYIDEHGTLSPEETLYIADRVSNALMVTHSANTLHRDISPDNIMLCEDGNVKIIDFGAARQMALDNPKSMSVILKQGFAPLEQYQRRGKQGPWTDLYSLGATLYYAQTNTCLDDPMSRSDDDSEFQSNSFNIEPQLWEVIRHSLNIKIDDRYKDAFEFRAALDKVGYEPKAITVELPEEETAAVPLTPTNLTEQGVAVYPAEKKPLNKKLIAILSGAMGVMIVAGITVLAVALGGKKNPIDRSPDNNSNYQQALAAQSVPDGHNKPENVSSSSAAVSAPAASTSASTSSSTSSQSSAASTPASTSTTTSSSSTPASASSQTPATSTPVSTSSSSSSQSPAPNPPASTSTTTSSSSTPAPAAPTTVTIKGKSYSTSLTVLDLSEQELTDSDIKDLKYFTNLKTLNLLKNKLTDLSALSSLTGLEELSFNFNDVSNVSFVSGMKNLKVLYFAANNVSDISPLSGLTRLERLNVSTNPITSIAPLKNMTGMKDLTLSSSISDISAVSGMKNLEWISLGGCEITNISALKNCTNLSVIQAGGISIDDLSPLHNCKSIKALIVYDTMVKNKKTFFESLKGLHMEEGGSINLGSDTTTEGAVFDSKSDALACKNAIIKNSGITDFKFRAKWYENGKVVRDYI